MVDITSFSQWSATVLSNDNVAGYSIAENGMYPPYVNNVDQNQMAQLSSYFTPNSRGGIKLTDTSAGATIGPQFILDRNSASPAVSDILGALSCYGRNLSGTTIEYAGMFATIADATAGSEDGTWTIQVSIAGLTQDVAVVSGTGLAVTGAVAATGALSYVKGAVTTSTYTPTLSNVANAAALVSSVFSYSRNGDTVDVWGQIQVDVTSAATLTQVGITLPIASNFANLGECGGSAIAFNTAVSAYGIFADTTNDTALLSGLSSASTANITYGVHFSYRII